jgi:hypothetical protein
MKRVFAYLSPLVFIALGILAYEEKGFFKRTASVTFYYWAWGLEGYLVHLELTNTGWKVTNADLTFIT